MTVTKEYSDGELEATVDGSGSDYAWFMAGGCFDEYTPETPTLWGDMTDAEKGALLLAYHEKPGSVQFWILDEWVTLRGLGWLDNYAYRIKPESKVEAVTLYLSRRCHGANEEPDHGYDTNKITFNTIDGKPDCDSIKMEVL